MASKDDLKVARFEMIDDKGGARRIIGTVENVSDHIYTYVEVQFNLFDASGAQVDSVFDTVTNLEGHTAWSFRTTSTFREAVSARLVRVVGDKAVEDGSWV